MTIRDRKLAPLWLGVAACFASLFYAGWILRPLANEGSQWLYTTINSGRIYFDPNFMRWSDTLFELPGFLFFKLWPAALGTTLKFLSLGYTLHPILSMLLCVWILHRARRMELVFFPALSLATATFTTIAFAVGIVPGALSYFWPAFLLTAFADLGSRLERLLLLICFLGLLFTHESAIFLFLPLVAAAWLRKRKSIAAISLGGIAWYAYRLLPFALQGLNAPPTGRTPIQVFITACLAHLDSFRIFCLAAVLLVTATLIAVSLRSSWKRAALPVMSLSILVAAIVLFTSKRLYANLGVPLDPAMFARTTAAPTAVFIAALTLVFQARARELASVLVFPIALILLVASVYDLRVSLAWSRMASYLEAQVSAHPGCVFIRNASWWSPPANGAIGPYTSILLQERRKVSSVFFGWPCSPDDPVKENPCESYANHQFNFARGTILQTSGGYFDFSPVTSTLGGS